MSCCSESKRLWSPLASCSLAAVAGLANTKSMLARHMQSRRVPFDGVSAAGKNEITMQRKRAMSTSVAKPMARRTATISMRLWRYATVRLKLDGTSCKLIVRCGTECSISRVGHMVGHTGLVRERQEASPGRERPPGARLTETARSLRRAHDA